MVFMMVLLSGLTLLLTAISLSVVSYLQEREDLEKSVGIQMEIVAFNSRAAMVFNDPQTAQKNLEALRVNPSIHAAVLFTNDGKPFATFIRPDPGLATENLIKPPSFQEHSALYEGNNLILQQTVLLDGEKLGTIVIHSDLAELQNQLLTNALLMLGILSFSLLLAFILAYRLQRLIAIPIESLRLSTIEIGKGRFDIPIGIYSQDEIGQLAQTVKQMATDLARQRADLERATRAKSDFLANMSHEIRTPMNAIIGLNDLALKHNTHPKIQDYLAKMRTASASLLRIVNDILDFSKIEAGKLTLERTPFYLDDLFDRLSDLFHNQAADKNIELILELAQDCPLALCGDVLRLEQILMNLIGNAIKFTDQGSVHVRAATTQPAEPAQPPFHCAAEAVLLPPPDLAVMAFSVRDSGIGLSQEQIGGLFLPFVQADGSTTRRYGGSGLGLSICARLVALMGGSIGVESVPGKGSCFHFTIVCGKYSNSGRVETPASVIDYENIIHHIGGSRILLVEDMPINQQVARELLEGVGIRVDVAGNGAEAVQKVMDSHYDAVLMDIQMPVMDGYEATRAIRQDPRFARLPIIAMTAHAMNSDREKSLAAGMEDHLCKPIDPEQFFSLLMTHIKPGRREPVDRERLLYRPGSVPPLPTDPMATPGLNRASALLRLMNNQALFMKLLATFARDYTNVAAEVREAFANQKPELAKKKVHQVKGVAGNIGAEVVLDAARQLELAIEQGRESEWPALTERFEVTLREILTTIVTLRAIASTTATNPEEERNTPQAIPPLDPKVLQSVVLELSDHLSRFSIGSTAAFLAAKPLLLQCGLDQEVTQMTEQIERFKFKEANASLLAIAQKLNIAL